MKPKQQALSSKPKQQPASSGRGRRWIIGIISTVGVVWGSVWFVGYLRASHQVAKVQELQKQLAESQKLPEQQRRELWGQMRQEMEQLPEEYQQQMWQDQRARFEEQMDTRIRSVLSLPANQRTAAIDKEINEMEARRKEWEQRRQQREAGNAGGRPGGDRGGARFGGPGASGPGSRGRGDGQRGAGGRDPTGKAGLERTKRRLDHSTAQQRAERAEFRRLVAERRQQRGLPANPWPR